MSFSPLASLEYRIPSGGRYSPRYRDISGFTVHHQYGVNAHGEATNPSREVSANYWVTNEGLILPHIDEIYRPWTTGDPNYPAGAESDHRNITAEVSNSPEGMRLGTFAISPAAKKSLEMLIGDVFKRHGLGKVFRGLYSGVAVHRDFVATECPGGYIMNNLSSIIENAENYRVGGSGPSPVPEDWWSNVHAFEGKSSRTSKQIISGGDGLKYVTFLDKHSDSKFGNVTIARGPGYVFGTEINVGLSGEPGTRVSVKLVRETGSNANRKEIGTLRTEIDTFGRIDFQMGYSGYLKRGELIRLLVQPQNEKSVVVETFYWSGMNRPGEA